MNSYYIVTFSDGTVVNSKDLNWHHHASKIKVMRRGLPHLVYANNTPIKSIQVFHAGLEKTLDVPEGCRVFQSTSAQTIFYDNKSSTRIIGRTIGIVKDNEVIEEYNLSGDTGTIIGFKL